MHHTISREMKFVNSSYQISSWFQVICKFPSSSWSLSFVAIPGRFDNRIVTVSLHSEQWRERDCKSRSNIAKKRLFLMKGGFFYCIANFLMISFLLLTNDVLGGTLWTHEPQDLQNLPKRVSRFAWLFLDAYEMFLPGPRARPASNNQAKHHVWAHTAMQKR